MDKRHTIDDTMKAMEGKSYGDALYWRLNEEGTLRIFGKGSLPDYSCGTNPNPPWQDKKQQIRRLILDNGITELGVNAFEGCENLKTILLPESLRRIRSSCFRGCHSLRRIIEPIGVQYRHVYEPEDEETVKEPVSSWRKKETVVTLGLHSFTGTPWAIKKWGEYYIKNGILIDCLRECETAVLPEEVREIGTLAFMNMPIQSVKLPKGLARIAQGAFQNTLLQEIRIPQNLENIEYGAFAGSRLSTAIFSYGNEAQIDKDAFAGTDIAFSGRLRDLYELDLKTWEKGCDKYKRLFVKKRKKLAGRNILDAGSSILRRIKRGAVIIGIEWDNTEKRVINMKGFVWDSLYEHPHEYVIYPYYEDETDKRGAIGYDIEEARLLDDSFFSESPERLVNSTGIRDIQGIYEEWFYSRDVENFSEKFGLDLLEKWLDRNPDYTLRSK